MNTQFHETASINIQSLIQSLGSNQPVEREHARLALASAGHTAVIPLIEALHSPESLVCWEAAKALAEIKDPAAANALSEALEHDDGDVRWVAANALIALGREGLKQTLVALLTKARSVPMQESARHVVSYFAHRYRGEALRPLLRRFAAFQPAVAIPPAALHALHDLEQGYLRP